MPSRAAPASGPAGNFIINVSTTVSQPAFNVSSGTVSQQFSLPFLTPGQCQTTDSTGKVIGIACGAGAASVAFTTGVAGGFTGPPISSPTAVVNFDSNTFIGALKGASTFYLLPNPSSVTLQGNNLAATYLTNSSATATYLQLSSATATYLQNSSATATYIQISTIVAVAHGGTGTSTPGLVAGTNMGSFTGTWPNITINAASTLVTSTASVTAGHCAQFSAAAGIIDAGNACGSGSGGGPNGQINTAAQYSAPYYSVSGSSNVLSGLAAGTSGYFLTTQGSAGPPFWTAPPTGGGSGIVSPGTFTWTNTYGINVSTIVASTGTLGNYSISGATIANNSTSGAFVINSTNSATNVHFNLADQGLGYTTYDFSPQGQITIQLNQASANNGAFSLTNGSGYGTYSYPGNLSSLCSDFTTCFSNSVSINGRLWVDSTGRIKNTPTYNTTGNKYAMFYSTNILIGSGYSDIGTLPVNGGMIMGELVMASATLTGTGLQSLSVLGTDSSGHIIAGTASGSASTLSVGTGTASAYVFQASSPTAIVNFEGTQFNAALKGSATAYISLNTSSVTLQGNSISLSALSSSMTAVGISTGSLQTQITAGATTYIKLTSALQSGATFYVSSGTVGGPFTATGTVTMSGPGGATVTYGIAVGSMTASSATLTGQFRAGTYQGGSLATCGDSSHALSWSGGSFGCQSIVASGGGSALAVTTGTSSGFSWIASSPTAVVNFSSASFSAALTGSATAFITLNSTQSLTRIVWGDGTVQVSSPPASGGSSSARQKLHMTFDGSGGQLSIGSTYYVIAGSSGTLDQVYTTCMTTSPTVSTFGSLAVNVSSSAAFGVSNIGSVMCASDCPSLSNSISKVDKTLSGWTTAVAKDTVYWFTLQSVTGCVYATIDIEYLSS